MTDLPNISAIMLNDVSLFVLLFESGYDSYFFTNSVLPTPASISVVFLMVKSLLSGFLNAIVPM